MAILWADDECGRRACATLTNVRLACAGTTTVPSVG